MSNDIETGTVTLRREKSGAISAYFKKGISELVTLPLGKDLKAEWHEKEEILCIKRL